MTTWAKPGAKCVCVDALPGAGPVNGQVVEIASVVTEGEKIAIHIVGYDFPLTDIALDHYSIQYLIDIIRQTAEIRRAGAN